MRQSVPCDVPTEIAYDLIMLAFETASENSYYERHVMLKNSTSSEVNVFSGFTGVCDGDSFKITFPTPSYMIDEHSAYSCDPKWIIYKDEPDKIVLRIEGVRTPGKDFEVKTCDGTTKSLDIESICLRIVEEALKVEFGVAEYSLSLSNSDFVLGIGCCVIAVILAVLLFVIGLGACSSGSSSKWSSMSDHEKRVAEQSHDLKEWRDDYAKGL